MNKLPSRSMLLKTIRVANDEARGYLDQVIALREELAREKATTEHVRQYLTDKLNAKVDTAMIEARTKLMSQIGQSFEAISQCARWCIGKEQL